MKAIFLDIDTLGTHINLTDLSNQIELIQYGQTPRDEDLIAQRISECECVITNKVPITQAILKQCPNIKIVLAAATGIDHIDIKSCTAMGIPVCNTRNYTGSTLAQHVFASILYFTNHQHLYHQSIIDKTWSQQQLFCLLNYPIMELAGKTLGIVGYGNLGKVVAQLGQGFGMHIKICKSLNTQNKLASAHIDQTEPRYTFEEILSQSDFISIHCPLTAATEHLFSNDAFKAMKQTAYLINTARGGIVDSTALLHALDEGHIAGAALDVFTQEPLPSDHALLKQRPNLLLTPHNAWGSLESRQRLVGELAENLKAWIQGSLRNECASL